MSEIPFVYELQESSYKPHTTDALKSFKERPDKIVRVQDKRSGIDYKRHSEQLNESRKHFQEMEEKYGIRVVEMDFVIGKDENDRVVTYTIVDNIIGKNLNKISEFPAGLKEDTENFFYGLAKYYNDKFDTRTKYWADFGIDQFVYGHKVNETDNHFYLVDVDPAFDETFFAKNSDEYAFEEVIEIFWYFLQKVEAKFKPPVEFSKARQVIAEIKDKINREKNK